MSIVNWSEYEDEIADAISDSMDMDWTSRDGAKAVVRALSKIEPPSETKTAWLIEQDAPHGSPVWFTATGPQWRFSRDANDALRFARKADAETFIHWLGGNLVLSNPRATEHAWLSPATQTGE